MEQDVLPLYPDNKVPNQIRSTVKEDIDSNGHIRNITNPSLTIYQPTEGKSNGTAIIILPGGSYEFVSFKNEGTNVAEQFVKEGITAFILKYRLPDATIMKNKSIGPLQDVQQAIKIVRRDARQWNIDPSKIGIAGFSAGGHLASTAGTHFKKPEINPEGINLRPDFMLLLYPVISLSVRSIVHAKSSNNLLGETPSSELMNLFSTELQVTPQTPPAFIMHATDDDSVSIENAQLFYDALITNEVPCELFIYPKGGHGFGIKNPYSSDSWLEQCFGWMKRNRWLIERLKRE